MPPLRREVDRDPWDHLNPVTVDELTPISQAPTDLAPLRLVEGGFANREDAYEAMFVYAEKLRALGDVERYGICVQPMWVRNPNRAGRYLRRRAGWGIYVKDRAAR
jgi:hypothetical protein